MPSFLGQLSIPGEGTPPTVLFYLSLKSTIELLVSWASFPAQLMELLRQMESSYSSEARLGSPETWRPMGRAAGVAATVTTEKGIPLRLRFSEPVLKH